jgi:hypothetical protein
VETRLVDPRDVTREFRAGTYRVIIWRQREARPPGHDVVVGWMASAYDLTGAQDVHEVIAWAEQEVGRDPDSRYTLWVKVEDAAFGEPFLMNLAGQDPTDHRLRKSSRG